MISLFLGDRFCKNLGLNPDQLKGCQTYIKAFMPPALEVMGELMTKGSPKLCAAWFDNICKA